MMRYAQLPPPPPGTPSPFSFARPGTLGTALREAGFAGVQEETRTIPWSFTGSVTDCWRDIQEIGAPAFHRIFAALTPEQHEQGNREVLAAIRAHDDGTQVNFPAVVVAAVGERATAHGVLPT